MSLKYCIFSIYLAVLSCRVTLFLLLFSYEKPPPGLIKVGKFIAVNS